MNTPAHLIFGMTAFAKIGRPAVTGAAFAGGVIPDLSLYVLAGTQLLILGTDPHVVFGQMYYSEAWQSVFRIDNSFVLWGIALVLGIVGRSQVMIALCGSAMLHLLLDFALHHNDARAQFWPITEWIFESPLSYWDHRHYADIVGFLEIVVALGCCVVLWRRFTGTWMRGLIVVLAAAETLPRIVFDLIFGGG